MASHWINEEIKHLEQCGATIEHIAMIIASDYFRKMGVMEVQEACQVLKADHVEIFTEIEREFPHRVK